MDTKVRVGVLGLGKHARNKILPALRAVSDTLEVTSLCTRNASVLAELGSTYDSATFSDPRELLDYGALDVVYISGPQSLHEEWSAAALSAGKHVWCEKALASTTEGWQRLIALAHASGLALCETWQFPYHPQFLGLTDFLRSGRLGRMLEVDAVFTVPHFPDRTNFRYQKDLGGGAFLDLASYTLRMAALLAGPTPREIEASIGTEAGFEVDTHGSATLTYDDGVVCRLRWGFGFEYRNQLHVRGELGELVVPFAFTKQAAQETEIRWSPHAGNGEVFKFAPADPFVEMFKVYEATITSPTARSRQWTVLDEQAQLLASVHEALSRADRR